MITRNGPQPQLPRQSLRKSNPGEHQRVRLPPVRVVQHQLGVAKQTVARAYEELQQRGLVINKPRLGYYAADLPQSKSTATKRQTVPGIKTIMATFPPLARTAQKTQIDDIYLGSVFIDKSLLPLSQIQKCFKSVLSASGLH